MRYGLDTLAIRRPVAVAMFFLGLVLLGMVGWQRLPVELFPNVGGDRLFVTFLRPGSEPEVVEREMLLPLEARVRTLSGVAETWGQVSGSGGELTIRFERGAPVKVRELDLNRIAADIARSQPRGAFIDVSSNDTGILSSVAMVLQATGEADRNTLHELIENRVVPRLAAVPGVSQTLVAGGASRQLTVWVDPARCAALDVTPQQVVDAVRAASGRLRYLGSLEDESGRTAVMLDGRPVGPVALGDVRVVDGRPVQLRHVAEIEIGPGRREMAFRVNGEAAVSVLVFQEEGANLVRLGRDLRRRIAAINEELEPIGVSLLSSLDAADLIEEQVDRLRNLGLSGFMIALLVLFLFLREWRAVAVVAIAVPTSLAAALGFLYLADQSLNLISLFGLVVGIGLLVDNSVVVYESVQRRLERGHGPDSAAAGGVRRTARAIIAASATTAAVFLPPMLVDLDSEQVRQLIAITAWSILLPLLGSLLVAIGLVPLLARWLAAPAALRRVAHLRRRRERLAGEPPPEPARLLFSGWLAASLRRPATLVTLVALATVLTVVIALPIVASGGAPPARIADQVQLSVRLTQGRTSLDAAVRVFERLEASVRNVDGIDRTESTVREEGGAFTVHLLPEDERPPGLDAALVRRLVRDAARQLPVRISRPGEEGGRGGGGPGGGGGNTEKLLGGGSQQVLITGNDHDQITAMATEIADRLEGIEGVAFASPAVLPGPAEIHVSPNRRAFEHFGILLDDVLPMLNLAGREGSRINSGYPLPSGRELPIEVQRLETAPGEPEVLDGSGVDRNLSLAGLSRLRISTRVGVLPVAALAEVRQAPAAAVITHHNGRRERAVTFGLSGDVPGSGPERLAVNRATDAALASVHRPPGTGVQLDRSEEGTAWFSKVLVPVVALLFLVLAVAFESMTLPVLVLLALPLTLLGSLWALTLSGMSLVGMALLGALVLLGLAVNPAVLLVDRMQQRTLRAGWSAGAAALAAVRERTRPVLMTTATTVAALAPLAIPTGRENELWPPFAVLVIGGLATSTVLTLLVIPVGYVFLRRLDEIFSRVGPWVVLVWLGATLAVIMPLFAMGIVESMLWRVTLTILIGGALLGLVVWLLPGTPLPEPATADGPPRLVVRHLRKVYGLPGPLRRALRARADFALRVLRRGGRPFHPADARERLAPLFVLLAGAVAGAVRMPGGIWRLLLVVAAVILASRFTLEIRRARGRVDETGRVLPGGIEGLVATLLPWAALAAVVTPATLAGGFGAGQGIFLLIFGAVVATIQLGRRTARLETGRSAAPNRRRRRRGRLVRLWRRVATRIFGLDMPLDTVQALAAVSFEVDRGMVGVLGPNGAGKTTLLRQLSGILDSTRGRITIGGSPLLAIRRYLARWVGYLPQDAGLPERMTARQYLEYYAALYQIGPSRRRERIETLLTEVGLAERAAEPIGGYSGGMRQRVAVARTLLRLPPIIVVDEPTVGLDPRERVRFRNLLARLATERIVLFSTHVVEDVAVACERVLVLSRGRLVFDGPPEDLSRQAEGRVWSWRTTGGEPPDLPPGAVLADSRPEGEGHRVRVLARRPPAETADPVDPTLEDGYLWLARAVRPEAPA